MCDKSFNIPFELDNMENGDFSATNVIAFQLNVEMCDQIPWSNMNKLEMVNFKLHVEWTDETLTRCDDVQNGLMNA